MPWTKVMPEVRELEWLHESKPSERMLGYPQAIYEALDQALALDPRVFVMGQGVDDPGGMFGSTKGLHNTHGAARCFDLPGSNESTRGCLQAKFTKADAITYMGQAPITAFLLLSEFCSFGLQHHAIPWLR